MVFYVAGCGNGRSLLSPLGLWLGLELLYMTLLTQHFDHIAHTAFLVVFVRFKFTLG